MNDPQQSKDRDTAISRLYHDAAGEVPPPPLDADVLQRARAAVSAAPARASRWSWGAWQARFAVLATVVISFTLLLVSQQASQQSPDLNEGVNEARTLRDTGSAAAVRPQAAPASPAPTTEKVQPGRPSDAAGTPAAAPAKAAETMSKIVVPAPLEPARPAPPAAAPPPPLAPSAPATPPALAQPAPPASPAAETARALQRAPEVEGRARDAAPAAAARAGASANSTAASPERTAPARPLDEWVARIRELRKQGQAAEAARELEALRKQYPAARLPEDLQSP